MTSLVMMMDIDIPDFSSKDDEIQYFKELADQLIQRNKDVEQELEEFQDNSQALEKELEASLEQTEKALREAKQKNSRLISEVDDLRSRVDQKSRECCMLQSRNEDLSTQNDKLLKYIRELEQKNDDLERAHRVSKVTEEEMEAKFNVAIEKTALLESELDEKEALKIKVQRLKDEIRDLKQEIQVYSTTHPGEKDKMYRVDSNKLQVELETSTPNSVNAMPKITNGVVIGNNNNNNNHNNNNNPSLAPCTRILAMNIIGDLMRKVGALENKLNTCRNASREDQAVRDLYRTRRQMRTLASNNNNRIVM